MISLACIPLNHFLEPEMALGSLNWQRSEMNKNEKVRNLL